MRAVPPAPGVPGAGVPGASAGLIPGAGGGMIYSMRK
jgi:hypothetical protein